ncbi:MAG: F0F1 ATP synthase subunit gamma [Clostridiales Family XIII bacterium]|jgi:F0F1-type ATP synthase gamma subunit|nr:F0F1 ATP synthase subunit gamma [Clostridiales Family XIII bacterium]
MNVKSVVKVMNFHALLRVEKARKQAVVLSSMRFELEKMLRSVALNRNLRLDKLLKLPDARLPALRIYLGSDYGFCGSVNSSVSSVLARDADAEKIVIGKKIRGRGDVSLSLTWDAYYRDVGRVLGYFTRAVREQPWSAVELVYNRYNNVGSVGLDRRKIYPVNADGFKEAGDGGERADYIIESNITGLLEEMLIAYSFYEFRIAAASAYASENTLRQSSTQDSIKKLDEREAEETRVERKEKNEIAFRKTIDNYTRRNMPARE